MLLAAVVVLQRDEAMMIVADRAEADWLTESKSASARFAAGLPLYVSNDDT